MSNKRHAILVRLGEKKRLSLSRARRLQWKTLQHRAVHTEPGVAFSDDVQAVSSLTNLETVAEAVKREARKVQAVPMSIAVRSRHYSTQNGSVKLTPNQIRRLRKKHGRATNARKSIQKEQ